MNERRDYEGKKASWFIIGFSAFAAAICLMGASGCFLNANAAESSRQLKNGQHSNHDFYTMYTSLHDGHWYVVLRGQSNAILHHPDCPCGKASK